jgi:predicted nucleic acid-binding protein
MILVDTSVWIDHFRRGVSALAGILEQGSVLMHPFILGELACGNLKNRAELLRLLQDLPRAQAATDAEVLDLIERRALMGRGIGYIDAHLLASAVLTDTAPLWTRDKLLNQVAQELNIVFREHE